MDEDVTDAATEESTDLVAPGVESAAGRGRDAQRLLDRVRADTARVKEIQHWLDEVIDRENQLTTYLRGKWLADRDILFTAAVAEGDFDVFDEDEPWEVIARSQAARRALDHLLEEQG